MYDIGEFEDGGFRFVKGVFQYSGGVAPHSGYRIERATLRTTLPLQEGFATVEAHLAGLGRPMTAFCACELRSPAPFDEAGFRAFNEAYVSRLDAWGLIRDGVNPVARTNVCPEIAPPAAVGLYAFSYTVPDEANVAPSFVIAGSGEAPEGGSSYRDGAVRFGDQSPEGMREKARFVLGEMERRMASLGFGWREATGVHLYTVYDVHPFLAEELVARGATGKGLTWHFARPPVAVLDYEMDVRSIPVEFVI